MMIQQSSNFKRRNMFAANFFSHAINLHVYKNSCFKAYRNDYQDWDCNQCRRTLSSAHQSIARFLLLLVSKTTTITRVTICADSFSPTQSSPTRSAARRPLTPFVPHRAFLQVQETETGFDQEGNFQRKPQASVSTVKI